VQALANMPSLSMAVSSSLSEAVRDQMADQFKPKTETVKYYLTSSAIRSEQKDHIMILNYDTMALTPWDI